MDYTIEQFDVNSNLSDMFSGMTKELYSQDPFYIPANIPDDLDGQLFMVTQGNRPVARAAALVNPDISFEGHKTGMIGYFEAYQDGVAVKALFEAIEKYQKSIGCSFVIGPMNGSTWNKYRLTIPDSHMPFFLDNYHKPWYADQFASYGFRTVAKYYSSRQKPAQSDRIEKFEKRFAEKGIHIRTIRDFQADLRQIYEMSRISFSNNYLYTPIEADQFMGMYKPIEKYIDPNYVLLAEDKNEKVVGFVFAVPNIFSQQIKSLVIKTLAVLPDASQRGLGSLLVEILHQQAIKDGYSEVIHGLMYEENRSTKIASGFEELFRQYHLFGKEI